MRRDVFFSISLVAVIDFLNASTLPLDFQPTGQDLQFVNLGPEVQNRPLPCFGESPDSSIVNKRQETTNCIGGNCGANDNVVPESSITKNQPVKWNDLFDNREESPELAVNLDSGSHDNMFSDGNKDWNNAIAYMPFNDAITNIPSSAPNEHNTVDQTEPDIFRGADGALNDAFEIAAKKAPQTTPKEPPPFVNQDPTTGEPIENSCLVPPNDQSDVYLVRLVEFKSPKEYRNPQAILVSKYVPLVNNRFDVYPGPARKFVFREVPNWKFVSGKIPVELNRYEPRGWLVEVPDEPSALEWFRALARSVPPPSITTLSTLNDPHFTAVWVSHVFKALANSNSPIWVPISTPA